MRSILMCFPKSVAGIKCAVAGNYFLVVVSEVGFRAAEAEADNGRRIDGGAHRVRRGLPPGCGGAGNNWTATLESSQEEERLASVAR